MSQAEKTSSSNSIILIHTLQNVNITTKSITRQVHVPNHIPRKTGYEPGASPRKSSSYANRQFN